MNLLIVDDERAARMGLIELCERAQGVRVVGEAGTGAGAIEAMESLRPDLMLLDADLPDMSGFDVLRALGTLHQRRTVLVSANAHDTPGAFAAGAIDHLVKPVNEAALSVTLLRARAHGVPASSNAARVHLKTETPGEAQADRLLLLVGEREHRLYPLDARQITYIESAGNYVSYHHGGLEYIARESIKRLATVLVSAGFMRIKRSLLLNVRAIAYAQPIGRGSFGFTLVSGTRLQSSDTYRDAILAVLPLQRRQPREPGYRAPSPQGPGSERPAYPDICLEYLYS
jgi:two-component system, LytTR family, response regulator